MFKYFELKIIKPDFESNLTSLIIDLEHLRRNTISGSTLLYYFSQLQEIFHMLESIYSARIEGNRTTISEFIDEKVNDGIHENEDLREIKMLEKAIKFINENKDFTINRLFISELHKIATYSLQKEGSQNPGEYRKCNVNILKSNHKPPEYLKVCDYMEELINFINEKNVNQYDLLKIALVYHRFVWIHPFDNGNGRTARLLTYAMLIKNGFNINNMVNISSIFCLDRNKYFEFLSLADTGDENNILKWCEYVLSGLKIEIEKINRLLDVKYFNILIEKTIVITFELKNITDTEKEVLKMYSNNEYAIKNKVVSEALNVPSRKITYLLSTMKNKGLIKEKTPNSREYIVNLSNNIIMKNLILILQKEGFIPFKD
ncbi:MAG: Fic family protein [Rickettsiales bacterium]|nr:Fic family protein [Rickettsiales bacterium]